MATINPDLSGIVDGAVGDASDFTTPFNTIINEINGNLDNNNIAASAGLDQSKISTTSLGYVEVSTPDQTGMSGTADLTSLTVTVTVPAGGRRIEITGFGLFKGSTTNVFGTFQIKEGTSVLASAYLQDISGNGVAQFVKANLAAAVATAGSHTYKLTWVGAGGGTMSLMNTVNTSSISVKII